jgi:hypothetical protein
MANITISNLNPVEVEFSELSDLELEVVMGGKERYAEAGYNQKEGAYVKVGIKF